MKRVIPVLLLVVLSLAICFPVSQAALPGSPTAIAMLFTGEKSIPILPVSPATPQSKAAALRNIFPQNQDDQLFLLGFGSFEFGKDAPLMLPSGSTADHKITIRGMGIDKTILRGEVVSDNVGTNFQLGNTVVEDLTLINDCSDPINDGRCVGFDNGNFGVPAGPFTATLRRCNLWCRDWTVYNWYPGNKLLIEDCDIYTGRVGVAAENSGDGQDFTLRRCQIFGDASLSKSRGATSDQNNGGVFGVIARGGPVRLYDCDVTIKGQKSAWPSYTPRACGIVDRGGGGAEAAGNTAITLYNCRFHVDPNGADASYDLQLEFQYVRDKLRVNWANCWGSAADGSLTKSF